MSREDYRCIDLYCILVIFLSFAETFRKIDKIDKVSH